MLNGVERDLEHDLWPHQPNVPVILDRDRKKALCHRRDFCVRQARVSLADVHQPPAARVLHRERVVRQDSLALAVTPLDRGHDDVKGRQRPFQFQPREPATPRGVRALRILHHQPLVTARSGFSKDPIKVVGTRRRLDARQEKRRRETEAFEQPPPGFEGLVQDGPAVQPKEVEDDENDRHLLAELGGNVLAAEPSLQLEKPQDATVAMRQHLAVEKHVVADRRRTLDQLRERGCRLLEVAGEELDPPALAVKLAAHAVVLLLGPHAARTHPLEGLGRGCHRAGEHEANGLERSDDGGVELLVPAADGCFADVPRDEVDALDLGDGHVEGLRDGCFDEALAQPDAQLARDDFDQEARSLRVQSVEQLVQRHGLGRPARHAYGFERHLDFLQGDGLRLRAALERFTRPVADVRVLAEYAAELVLVATRQRRHHLAHGRPTESQRPSSRRAERAPAHEDRRPAQVVIVKAAQVGGEDACFLERGGRGTDRRSSTSEVKHGWPIVIRDATLSVSRGIPERAALGAAHLQV